jgi:hypothetical protein
MKKKLLAAFLGLTIACSGATTRARTTSSAYSLTEINMAPYNVQRSPEPTPITIRSVIGNAPPSLHTEMIYMYGMNETNPVRPFVRGPWNGLCINEASVAQISTAANTVALSVQNDEFQRLRTLSAYAQRDIATLRSDFRMLELSMQAQINDRDISLREQEQIISSLRRGNIIQNLGVGLGGLLLGLGVSGLIIITQ